MNIYSISSLILETGNITNRNGIRFVLYFCFVFSCSLSFPSFSFLFVWKQHLVVLEDYFCLSVCRLLLPVLICSRRNQIQASCFHSLLTFFLVFFFFSVPIDPFHLFYPPSSLETMSMSMVFLFYFLDFTCKFIYTFFCVTYFT